MLGHKSILFGFLLFFSFTLVFMLEYSKLQKAKEQFERDGFLMREEKSHFEVSNNELNRKRQEMTLLKQNFEEKVRVWEDKVKKDSPLFDHYLNLTSRNLESNVKSPFICQFVRTFPGTFSDLTKMSMSSSFTGIDSGHFRMYYILTEGLNERDWEKNLESLETISTIVNKMVGLEGYSSVIPLRYVPKGPDFGYFATDVTMAEFVYKKNPAFGERYEGYKRTDPSECEYVIFTNGDNYYSKNWLSHIHKLLPADLIYWDFVSHYTGMMINSKPKLNALDLGAAIFKLNLMRINKMTFQHNYAINSASGWDGLFVERFVAVSNSSYVKKISKILLFHE